MFLTFESEQACESFLEHIKRERPTLLAKLRKSTLQPTLVARNLIADEVSWLKSNVDASAKIHHDVQFAPSSRP
jgi:hypothetical protein